MTPHELHAALVKTGCKMTPDDPERGRLAITPPPPAGLVADIIKHKDALLQHLRDLAKVSELAGEIGGDGGDVDEADALLAALRAAGHAVGIDPADRDRIAISPRPDAHFVADVIRLKPQLFELLEAEGRGAELSTAPDPFPPPGVEERPLAEGAVRLPPDGVAGVPGGQAEAEGPAADHRPEAEAAPGVDVRPGGSGYVGWARVIGKRAKWQEWCRGNTWKGCWDEMLRCLQASEEQALEATVLPKWRMP